MNRAVRTGMISALATVAAAVMMFKALPANAHEAASGWAYPWSCCSNQDCRPVSSEWVKTRDGGYELPTGEIVPYSSTKIRPSPDGEYHWCSVAGSDNGNTICLFVPSIGS